MLIATKNRRLRHLQGITIRNLTFAPPIFRSRRKSVDDEALPYTLKSPAKIVAQREHRKLEHARSSTDLQRINEPDQSPELNGSPKARPTIGRLRRRSTMEWSGASPMVRQKKLEDVTGGRMADTFFSLHVDHIEGVEILKTITGTTNKIFRADIRK